VKVLIISNHPVVYRVDFFNALATEVEDVEFKFIFIADQHLHKEKISVYKGEKFIDNSIIIKPQSKLSIVWLLLMKIIQQKPDIIIVGGFSFYVPLLSVLSIGLRFKIVNWWGGTTLSESPGKMKKFYGKILALFIKGGIFYSQLAEDYFLNCIKPKLKYSLILGNNTRDAEKFMNKINKFKRQRDEDEKGILRFITIGFQNETKNSYRLLEAFSLLKQKNIDNIELHIVGNGNELPRLIEYSKRDNLPVIFHKQLSPDKTMEILANSDIFIHPSYYDRWPQTYTEAICAGLPVLISNRAGVYDDYIKKFADDVLFDPMDINDIADKMENLIKNSDLRRNLAVQTRQIALKNNGITGAKKLADFLHDMI
jgi:glycosyltransferase involved in cell wall biosynthesis